MESYNPRSYLYGFFYFFSILFISLYGHFTKSQKCNIVITMGCFEIAFWHGLKDLGMMLTSKIVSKEYYVERNVTYPI